MEGGARGVAIGRGAGGVGGVTAEVHSFLLPRAVTGSHSCAGPTSRCWVRYDGRRAEKCRRWYPRETAERHGAPAPTPTRHHQGRCAHTPGKLIVTRPTDTRRLEPQKATEETMAAPAQVSMQLASKKQKCGGVGTLALSVQSEPDPPEPPDRVLSWRRKIENTLAATVSSCSARPG